MSPHVAVAIPARVQDRWAAATIGAVILGWALLVVGASLPLLGFALLAAVWGTATAIDLSTHHLSDLLTLGAYPAFLILMLPSVAVDGAWGALGRAALVGLGTALVLFIIAFINPAGFGLGDVKLGLSTGAALGWFGVTPALLGLAAAFVLMAVVGLAMLATKRVDGKADIAFGPFMVAGVLIAPWLAILPT